MNTTDAGANITFPIGIDNSTMSPIPTMSPLPLSLSTFPLSLSTLPLSLSTVSSPLNPSASPSPSTAPASVPLPPPSYSSDIHEPEFTIMIVLGLSLLLAGIAAFLVVCQPSTREDDSETNFEDSFRSRNKSGEPQLKKWKRFGSYRRSYSASFRRPPNRRPESLHLTQILPKEVMKQDKPTTPCMCDYVTEI